MSQKLCHFFILTAFLLGIIAPACGFAWNGKFSIIEICTAKGIEQKVVSNDDLPSKHPSDPADHAQKECQFCFQNNNLVANIILPTQITHPKFSIENRVYAFHDTVYKHILSQYHSARAPPSYI